MSLGFLPNSDISTVPSMLRGGERLYSINVPIIMILPAIDCIDKPVPVQAETAIFLLTFICQIGDGTELDELFHFGDFIVANLDLERLGLEAGLGRKVGKGHDALMRFTDITVKHTLRDQRRGSTI